MELQLPWPFLRRPISVCTWDAERLTLLYKVVGQGTGGDGRNARRDQAEPADWIGERLRSGPCGGVSRCYWGAVLGVPPLYGLCQALVARGKQPAVVLGFNTQGEVFYEDRFRALGASVTVTTADGSYGRTGFVTDAMDGPYSYFYACGPLPMLRAIERVAQTPGQYSMEERMGCGFGACMGCTIQTRSGPRRVCKDGPVFDRGR